MEQPGVVSGNFALSFYSTFWAFLCISKAPFGRSLWSGHHWDLFLPQKLSIHDANFGQKWWRQKWKRGQGSSRVVMGSTGVNGLSNYRVQPLHVGRECSLGQCWVAPNPYTYTHLHNNVYLGDEIHYGNTCRPLPLTWKATMQIYWNTKYTIDTRRDRRGDLQQ